MGKVIMSGIVETLTAPRIGTMLSDIAVGSSVYLNEGGSPVEYLVVNHGIPSNSSLYDNSCDGVWLLRKDIHTTMKWDSTNTDYANSDVHAYLNSTFLGLLDSDIQPAIKQVKIPYTNGAGVSGSLVSGASGLSTKVFLLSVVELNITNVGGYNTEGSVLDYFSGSDAKEKRIAYLNGTAAIWWTRSPSTNVTKDVHYVTSNGSGGNSSCSIAYGVRPAMVLPSTALFDDNAVFVGVK